MRDMIGCEDKCGDYVMQIVGCKMNSKQGVIVSC